MVNDIDGATKSSLIRFWITAVGVLVIGLLAIVYTPGQDHLGAITLDGDPTWYRNYGDGIRREIQDRDIFFHDIGHSIAYARQADIIFLGHSMLLYGLDWRTTREFEKKYGVKIYNLGSAGDASGEFLLRVIKKHGLHPKLWIINVDNTGTNFFYRSLDNFGQFGTSAADSVLRYGRWHAMKNVFSRNINWRIEMIARRFFPEWVIRKIYRTGTGMTFYRAPADGNLFLDKVPGYTLKKEQTMEVLHDPHCPAPQAEIEGARNYLKEIGGSAIFIQVPHANECRQHVLETAKALGVPALVFDQTAFTSWDRGGHLNRDGAQKFTSLMLSQLEALPEFQHLFLPTAGHILPEYKSGPIAPTN